MVLDTGRYLLHELTAFNKCKGDSSHMFDMSLYLSTFQFPVSMFGDAKLYEICGCS